MRYSTYKIRQRIIEKISNIILFPLRCVLTPIDLLFKFYDKHKQNKRYSKNQIQEVVKYLIDYWLDCEEQLYIIADDNYNPFDFSNMVNAYYLMNLSWAHQKVKSKAFHIYTNQKDEYLRAIIELCEMYGTKMTEVDKKNEFFNAVNPWEFNGIKGRSVYKFMGNSN